MKGTGRNSEGMADRLVKIEILLGNHLAHHDKYFKYVMCPVLVGVLLLVVAKVYDYTSVLLGG